jgi:hypothetical protein
MNMKVENVNIGSVILGEPQHRDYALTFAAGPVAPATEVVMPSGTIVKQVGGKLLPFVVGDTDPVAVLTYDASATAAGDVQVRAMVGGRVRKELLIIAADGDATNVDNAVIDHLRSYGILAIDVNELNIEDNQ